MSGWRPMSWGWCSRPGSQNGPCSSAAGLPRWRTGGRRRATLPRGCDSDTIASNFHRATVGTFLRKKGPVRTIKKQTFKSNVFQQWSRKNMTRTWIMKGKRFPGELGVWNFIKFNDKAFQENHIWETFTFLFDFIYVEVHTWLYRQASHHPLWK